MELTTGIPVLIPVEVQACCHPLMSSVRQVIRKLQIGDDGEFSRFYQSIKVLLIKGSTFHVGKAITQECVGLFYNNRSGYGDDDSNAIMMPGSICGIAPPPVGVTGVVKAGDYSG
ncbi:TPA: hypothetical protein ACKP77_004447 [Serratia marcescens]